MPRAVVSAEVERKDLKTAPPDGFVELKRMSYGQKMQRTQIATDMTVEVQKGQKSQKASIDVAQLEVTLFEFRNCIVDHNLTDENDQKLNLHSKEGLSKLDPRVGDEIGKYIDELNNYDGEDDDLGN